jgi:hypothetical protein
MLPGSGIIVLLNKQRLTTEQQLANPDYKHYLRHSICYSSHSICVEFPHQLPRRLNVRQVRSYKYDALPIF